MPQNVAFDQDLHYLPLIQQLLGTSKDTEVDSSTVRTRKVRSQGFLIFRVTMELNT